MQPQHIEKITWRNSTASTPAISGSKKQSEEGAALFAVRVHVIVMSFYGLQILQAL